MSLETDCSAQSIVYVRDPALRQVVGVVLDGCGARGIYGDARQGAPWRPVAREVAGEAEVVVLELGEVEESGEGLGEVLAGIHQRHPSAQVVLLTRGTMRGESLCEAVRHKVGAIVDVTTSGFALRLGEKVREGLDATRELRRRRQEQRHAMAAVHGLVGRSRALGHVVGRGLRAAQVSDAPVLITGESGTGKGRLAELIHENDPKRRRGPFVVVNCAAIAGTLAESELFGHRRGAFTGATDDRLGYFRSADGGTILLDEVGELGMALQPKILRVLQEGLVLPVGSDREDRVDVRVLAATNQPLERLVEAGGFRLDLYQRLNVIRLEVPALRERLEDIPELFESFVQKYSHYYPAGIEAVEPSVYEMLGRGLGPGNIRELENVVRRVLAFKESGHRVEVTDLPGDVLRRAAEMEVETEASAHTRTVESLLAGTRRLTEVLQEYEQGIIRTLLESGLSQSELSQRLGITRRTLYNKLSKYQLK